MEHRFLVIGVVLTEAECEGILIGSIEPINHCCIAEQEARIEGQLPAALAHDVRVVVHDARPGGR